MYQTSFPFTDNFYNSAEWIDLRLKTLLSRGRRCECCGAGPARGKYESIQVDHVVPISIDPSRRLDPTNLQVLCYRCNHGKSSRTIDFRQEKAANQDHYNEYSSLAPTY